MTEQDDQPQSGKDAEHHRADRRMHGFKPQQLRHQLCQRGQQPHGGEILESEPPSHLPYRQKIKRQVQHKEHHAKGPPHRIAEHQRKPGNLPGDQPACLQEQEGQRHEAGAHQKPDGILP